MWGFDSLYPHHKLNLSQHHLIFTQSLKAIQEVKLISENPSNLEYDVLKTKRGNRDDHINDMLCEVTGAEACTIVNNNAAAVILVLNSY